MLLAGIAGQVLALVVFVDAHSVTALLAARIVQGLATGTAIGADRRRHARHRPGARRGGQRHRTGPRNGQRRAPLVVCRAVAPGADASGVRGPRRAAVGAGVRRGPAARDQPAGTRSVAFAGPADRSSPRRPVGTDARRGPGALRRVGPRRVLRLARTEPDRPPRRFRLGRRRRARPRHPGRSRRGRPPTSSGQRRHPG